MTSVYNSANISSKHILPHANKDSPRTLLVFNIPHPNSQPHLHGPITHNSHFANTTTGPRQHPHRHITSTYIITRYTTTSNQVSGPHLRTTHLPPSTSLPSQISSKPCPSPRITSYRPSYSYTPIHFQTTYPSSLQFYFYPTLSAFQTSRPGCNYPFPRIRLFSCQSCFFFCVCFARLRAAYRFRWVREVLCFFIYFLFLCFCGELLDAGIYLGRVGTCWC